MKVSAKPKTELSELCDDEVDVGDNGNISKFLILHR